MRKADQFQEKRQIILKGFSELIADNGLENVSFAKLAKYLNIPASLIFYYFKNKEELVDEVIEYVLDVCRERSQTAVEEINGGNAREAFTHYIESLFMVTENASPDETTHLRAYYVCYNLALRDKKVGAKFYSHQEDLRQMLKQDLGYFVRNGIVIEDIEGASEMLYCMMSGLADAIDFMEDESRKQTLAKRSMNLFMNYINF